MGKIFRAVKTIIKEPKCIIGYMNVLGLFNRLSDKKCVKLLWWSKTKRKLNLNDPRGFNEKMQWLKLYDHRPEYTVFVDKYLVREYVKSKIGEEYLIPLIGVWDKPEEIDFDLLPNRFVLKCNHNSGEAMCICTDKEKIDVAKIRSNFNRALSKNYYYAHREWPYKNVKPRIICEQFVVDNDPENTTGTLISYKFHCFNGEPKFLYVGFDDISDGTKGETKLSFFDLNFEPVEFYREDHKPMPLSIKKPEKFEEMIQLAKILSKDIPFVRVDLYWTNKQILFSEMTLFPGAGFGFFSPDEWEIKIGDWVKLPNETN